MDNTTQPTSTFEPQAPAAGPLAKPTKLKKSPILLLIYGLVFLALLGSGGYFLMAQKTKPTEKTVAQVSPTISQPSPTIDSINWKIYENVKLGFSMKYPETAVLGHESYGLSAAMPPGVVILFPSIDNFTLLQVQIWDVTSGHSTPKELLEIIQSKSKSAPLQKDINGIQFTTIETKDSNERNDFFAVTQYNNKLYLIDLRFSPKNRTLTSSIFSQILSSFKFTEQSSPTPPSGCYYKVCNYMCPKNTPHCCDNVKEELVCPSTTPSSYSCPATKIISCKPTGEEISEICKPDYVNWVQKNCSGVQITR